MNVDRKQQRAWLRIVLRASLSMPVCIAALVSAALMMNRSITAGTGPDVTLRTVDGRTGRALVFGAGTGIHLVRISASPVALRPDLKKTPLRIISLGSVTLEAENFRDPGITRASAEGWVVQLFQDRERVGVRTGL